MSVSKTAKRRGEILDEIMAYQRERLPKVMREVPLEDLRAFASVTPTPLDLFEALSRPGVSLIAECKKASPSKGLLVPKYDALELAKTYALSGASAISVLTDKRHFQGSLEDLRGIKEEMIAGFDGGFKRQIPILRKDFIFHPYQVYESRVAGADALLLIVQVLSDSELRDLLLLTHHLGMKALVEVHTEEEMNRALAVNPNIIGINNRNLQTFEVDFENTARLRNMVPADVVVVGESGIKNADDVEKMAEIGVNAILVGESLVRSKDVSQHTRSLVTAGKP
ncbi:MAG: indole-3-glycerol phosphate synthase TrpC [Candidatus Promineifilaceae bacterium]|jgi:indole-3-glycerol phosphate synthase